MSEAYREILMGGDFDALLSGVLRARRMEAEAPAGMEQRLSARLAAEEAELRRPQVFGFAEAVRVRRSAASVWSALGLHAAVFAALALLVMTGVRVKAPEKTAVDALTLPLPPVSVRVEHPGGGGGQHDLAPASQGRPPRPSPEQLMP
ncbi:MAG: hypothetical protein V4555_17305, partial [Acidobacteriota bacterium]